jgi:hypothetical protein
MGSIQFGNLGDNTRLVEIPGFSTHKLQGTNGSNGYSQKVCNLKFKNKFVCRQHGHLCIPVQEWRTSSTFKFTGQTLPALVPRKENRSGVTTSKKSRLPCRPTQKDVAGQSGLYFRHLSFSLSPGNSEKVYSSHSRHVCHSFKQKITKVCSQVPPPTETAGWWMPSSVLSPVFKTAMPTLLGQ